MNSAKGKPVLRIRYFDRCVLSTSTIGKKPSKIRPCRGVTLLHKASHLYNFTRKNQETRATSAANDSRGIDALDGVVDVDDQVWMLDNGAVIVAQLIGNDPCRPDVAYNKFHSPGIAVGPSPSD